MFRSGSIFEYITSVLTVLSLNLKYCITLHWQLHLRVHFCILNQTDCFFFSWTACATNEALMIPTLIWMPLVVFNSPRAIIWNTISMSSIVYWIKNYKFQVELRSNISNYFSSSFLKRKKAGRDQVLMARGACLIPFGLAVSGEWGEVFTSLKRYHHHRYSS